MPFVMPEVVLQKVISHGIEQLRQNRKAFYDIFWQYRQDELNEDYGKKYIDSIWIWFKKTQIPVVKAWSFNIERIPCISIHLSSEAEDESKAAIGDFAGIFDPDNETGTGVFTCNVDIGIHADKSGDHVLWLYYIVSYILFKHKLMAHRLGLKLHTYSASDYNKEPGKMPENIWTRWIRFRCTTQNFWDADELFEVEDINFEPKVGLPPAWDIAASGDVDLQSVDTTINEGLKIGRAGIDDPDDEMNF